jgi:hypothetical protein
MPDNNTRVDRTERTDVDVVLKPIFVCREYSGKQQN